ncbi:hypothetical protein PATSB16_20830 [Pandoraea thiooxydans]|uniref:Uncharacterized protein n=1 Tax=Pandoraea thiooxydans TaxID=445709 RepID=A0A0G3ES35_9BURK|nr:hypothetical protein [Pandoraea thiooxydans]AKJ68142.1 hypothetical protein ABW99_07885 [Pandoraea thiooxydans]APR95423.1 hypothetical protein PATSB16_20830 [Pandoraea thiooxydans]
MSLAPISGRTIPGDSSPYDVGAADLSKAQSDLKQLSALKVTANDYKDANATHGWWGLFNGFSDKSAKQALINRQTALEDDASKHLFNVAAANERGQVSPSMLKQAQGLATDLSNRLAQDYTNASSTDTLSGNVSHISQYSQTAYDRANPDESHNLQDALAGGNQPDAITLGGTPAFMKDVATLDKTITNDVNAYQYGATPAIRDAAKARLSGIDSTQLTDFFDQVDKQTGYVSITTGISGPKIASLPDGDPQKAAYLHQYSDLINLVRGNGSLERDNRMLTQALSGAAGKAPVARAPSMSRTIEREKATISMVRIPRSARGDVGNSQLPSQ